MRSDCKYNVHAARTLTQQIVENLIENLSAKQKAVQHERKPLLDKKSVNSSLHNANETFASNNNSNSASGGKQQFGNNMNSLSSIIPAHIFANFTSNVAQQGE